MQVLYRLRSAAERLGIRRESSTALLEQVRVELADVSSDAGDPGVETAELERAALDAGEAARVAAVEREARAERARQVLTRLLAAEKRIASRRAGEARRVLVERGSIEAELTGAAGERELHWLCLRAAQRAARLAVQRESATRLIARCAASSPRRRPTPRAVAVSRRARAAGVVHARRGTRSRARARPLAERALTAQERLATLERSLAEREGIPPAARALAEQGETLALSTLQR